MAYRVNPITGKLDYYEVGSVGEQGPQGEQGENGTNIELQKSLTHVQWRYVGEESWTNLIELTDITGPQGEQGLQGEQGEAGEQGEQGERGLQGLQGVKGDDGSDASVTKENVEAVLTGEIASHSHSATGLTQPQVMARSLGC